MDEPEGLYTTEMSLQPDLPQASVDEYQRWARSILTLMGGITAISNCEIDEHIARVALDYGLNLFEMEAGYLWKRDPSLNKISLWMENPAANQLLDPQVGHLLAEQVLESNKPSLWHLEDPQLDAEVRLELQSSRIRAHIGLLLTEHEQPFGILQFINRQSILIPGKQQMAMGILLARNASIALERVRLRENAEKRLYVLETLRHISLSLTATLDLSTVLDMILKSSVELLEGEVRTTHIFLYKEGKLEFAASWFEDGQRGRPFAEPRPHGLTYTVARSGKAVLVPDMHTHSLYKDAPREWYGSIVGLPLKIGERVVGVMSVSRKKPNSFNEEHLQILHFLADHAAIAIENARLHSLIQQQAFTDPLTNIPNRRALDNHLDREIRRARRYQHHFTVLMVDLNGFKRINDCFGHPQGDRVLQHATCCLQASLRDTDFLARYGGDEFAVILPETDVASAQVVSEKLARALAASPIELGNNGEKATLTLSIGIATYPQDGNTPDELIFAADRAMYTAKEGNILYTTYS